MSEIIASLANDEGVNKVLKGLSELEETAEDILGDRGLILELEKRNNGLREASRALEQDNSEKVWLLHGPLFIKVRSKFAKEVILRDQERITSEVESVRDELKVKVNKLRDIENQPNLKGFDLTPLSRNELAVIGATPGSQVHFS